MKKLSPFVASLSLVACAPALIREWHVQVLPESEENREKLRECQVLNDPKSTYQDATKFIQCVGTVYGYETRSTTVPPAGVYPEQSWVIWWHEKMGVTNPGCKPTEANFELTAPSGNQLKNDTYYTILCPQQQTTTAPAPSPEHPATPPTDSAQSEASPGSRLQKAEEENKRLKEKLQRLKKPPSP